MGVFFLSCFLSYFLSLCFYLLFSFFLSFWFLLLSFLFFCLFVSFFSFLVSFFFLSVLSCYRSFFLYLSIYLCIFFTFVLFIVNSTEIVEIRRPLEIVYYSLIFISIPHSPGYFFEFTQKRFSPKVVLKIQQIT